MDFDHSSGRSPRACRRCKLLKRKCDKALPKCYSCSRSHFKCLYPSVPDISERPVSYTTSTALSEIAIRSLVSGSNLLLSDFPPIYFVDFELYQRAVSEIPKAITTIRPDLQALAGDIREQAKIYFRTIHPWVPILSKKLFNERLLNPFTPRGTDVTLLFACVKLICSIPENESMWRSTYITIKGSLMEAEVAGMLSIRGFQAWILLALFEFGHSIYPSAYLSIGVCARYAAALGIHLNETIGQRERFHWIEAEERARALWAVVMLDRFLNLGCQVPSLSTEDPNSNTKLPIDDFSWDRGIQNDDYAATISTPPTPRMGRFGLMAMAASLLGRVIRHSGDTTSSALHTSEEAAILDRALNALTTVAREEGQTRGIGVCTPTVFCHSARILLILHKQRLERAVRNVDNVQESGVIRYGIASDMVRLSQATRSSQQQHEEESCPFPLHAAYHAAIAYLEIGTKFPTDEYLEGLREVKSLLTLFSTRWKLGGVYLKLIDTREAISSSGL